ncbi:hypothetical protein [Actinomadura yumaensis]|uniref:Chromosome segregation ATPase n=1 Tax=Actinomadura yumaensis TaxID=111807 RepID=A0ABW2CGJ0_9ACTN
MEDAGEVGEPGLENAGAGLGGITRAEVEELEQSAASMTVPESLPEPLRPPETWVRGATVRPVGESWREAWQNEARMLRRGLLWLEQWPRDASALEAYREEQARRREELDAELEGMAAAAEELRGSVEEAERTAAEAEAESERLAGELEKADAEVAGPRAEAERLQAIADEMAAEAGELTRTADAAYARCAELDERAARSQAELNAARQQEESLTADLARAREDLPMAQQEAERLLAADADAAAEGHASYYRLVTAESALAARRRKMSLGQRLHVAAPPTDLKSLRAEVKARTRDADQAASRAQEAKNAAEQAESRRQEIAAFIDRGGPLMDAAREAQQRLGEELVRLASEREDAGAVHREQARLAAEAVDRATGASMEARRARQAAQEVEQRFEAARAARAEALTLAEQARAAAEDVVARIAEAEAAHERLQNDAEQEIAARTAELGTLEEAEARSRENVREICGSDPINEPDLLSTHQERAMARIEQLSGFLDAEAGFEATSETGEILLRSADLVAGTPVGIGASSPAPEFDVLIVAGAGEIPDADLLVGAVRARGWVLLGTPGTRPHTYEGYDTPTGPSPFERCAEKAPDLLRRSEN